MRNSHENPKRQLEEEAVESAILTSSEIGALSPRVPREAEMLREAPKPIDAKILDANGDTITYIPEVVGEFSPDTNIIQKGDRTKQSWMFKGRTKDGKIVIETDDGEGITIARRDFESGYEPSRLVYVEKTKDGTREIQLDAEAVLQESVEFYHTHDCKDFLQELPKNVRLSAASEAKLREAMREGFDKAMLFPKTETQAAHIEILAVKMAAQEISGLPPNEQYTAPYFENGTKTAETRNRPKHKAYLLLYQSGPIPDETKGQSPDQLDPLFTQKKWNGLTLQEYLILQRKELEARKNHSFDVYDDDAKKSQWTWLLDSRAPQGVVRADWNPGARQVDVYWDVSGHSYGRLGARPAVVVEVEV